MPANKAASKWAGHISDNAAFQEFRKQLEAKGVHFQWAWDARTQPDLKYPNVHCLLFSGSGFAPSVSVAIVVDYNATMGSRGGREAGFGLFTEEGTHLISDDVERIAKPRS